MRELSLSECDQVAGGIYVLVVVYHTGDDSMDYYYFMQDYQYYLDYAYQQAVMENMQASFYAQQESYAQSIGASLSVGYDDAILSDSSTEIPEFAEIAISNVLPELSDAMSAATIQQADPALLAAHAASLGVDPSEVQAFVTNGTTINIPAGTTVDLVTLAHELVHVHEFLNNP